MGPSPRPLPLGATASRGEPVITHTTARGSIFILEPFQKRSVARRVDLNTEEQMARMSFKVQINAEFICDDSSGRLADDVRPNRRAVHVAD